MENIAWMSRWEANIAQGKVKYHISFKTMPKYHIFYSLMSVSGTFTGLLYDSRNRILAGFTLSYERRGLF